MQGRVVVPPTVLDVWLCFERMLLFLAPLVFLCFALLSYSTNVNFD
jgi:hypothetical protein